MFFIILTYLILKNIKIYKETSEILSTSELLKLSIVAAFTNNTGYFSIVYVILLFL